MLSFSSLFCEESSIDEIVKVSSQIGHYVNEITAAANLVKSFLTHWHSSTPQNLSFCHIKASTKGTSTDLSYKNITIVNDTILVISEWCHNLEHHLQLYLMILAKAATYKTFIVQASLMIVTYKHQNIVIVQTIGNTDCWARLSTVDLLA